MSTPGAPNWRNRIVAYGEESPDQLLAHPSNARIHPLAQQRVLADVLSSVGLVQTIVVNRRTGCVLDGHLRAQMALTEGIGSVPVTYVDLDEEEESLIVSSFDGIGNMAAYDRALVAETVPYARAKTSPGSAVDQWLQDLAGRANRAIEREQAARAPVTPAPQDADPEVEEAETEDDAEAVVTVPPPVNGEQTQLVEVISLWYNPTDFALFQQTAAELGERYALKSTAAIVLRALGDAVRETQ
jgi:hypothetical protein